MVSIRGTGTTLEVQDRNAQDDRRGGPPERACDRALTLAHLGIHIRHLVTPPLEGHVTSGARRFPRERQARGTVL